MKSCEFKSKKDSFTSWLQSHGLVDQEMNILDMDKFQEANRQWSDYARYNYGTTQSLFAVQEGKAQPIQESFNFIDNKNVTPEVASNIGLTRLYRAEGEVVSGQLPQWLEETPEYQEAKKARGRWFYKNLDEAMYHADKFGSSGVYHVDIPSESVEDYNARDNKFSGGYGKQGKEYFVSSEIAALRVPLQSVYWRRTEHSANKISPELYDHLVNYVQSVNPDFRVEVLQNLSYSGATKMSESLIELKQGKEFVAMPEEVAHFYLELLNNKELEGRLLSEVTRTKMYKWVLNEYAGMSEYRNEDRSVNYDKLKREAAAKLISLYMQDRDAFEHWSGSPDLITSLKRLFDRLVNWIRGLNNPFSIAATQILQGNVSDLSRELIVNRGTFYQIEDLKKFETLGEDLTQYDRIYFNINNTLLDYANWKATKQVKSQMFTDLAYRSELNRFFQEAGLTKLGRELKDKIGILNPHRVTLFTDMPITPELITRLQDEYGPVNIVRTGFQKVETVFDEFGNPIDRIVIGSEKVKWMQGQIGSHPNGRLLFVDNQPTDIFKRKVANLNALYYSDKVATYTDYETRRRVEEANRRVKEFTQGVVEELQSVNKDSLIPLVRQSLNIVRTIVNRLENEKNQELTETFKDEYGNINSPIEKARVIKRLLEDTDRFEQGILHFVQTIESTRYFFNKANELDYRGLQGKGLRDLAESEDPLDNEKAIREAAILMRNVLSWQEWLEEIQPHIQDTKFIKKTIGDFQTELSTAKVKINSMAVNLLAKNFEKEWKEYNKGIEAKFKGGYITKEERDNQLITAQSIADWLYGRGGDISKWSYFENPLFIGDKVMSAVAKKLEIITQSADEKSMNESIELSQKLWDIGSKLALSDIQIGKKITYIDKEVHWENGEIKTRDVKMFLNPYKNLYMYELEREKYQSARDKWIEAKNNNNVTTELEDYRQAKKNWDTWIEQNWYDDLTWEGKHIYELIPGLVDANFDIAVEKQRELWKEVSEFEEDLHFPILSEEAEDNINKMIADKLREIRLLRNEYDEDGNLKPEPALTIARKLKQKSMVDSQIYESVLNKKYFLDSIKEQIGSISDETVKQTLLSLLNTDNLAGLNDYARLNAPQIFLDWLDRNTRIKFSDDLYQQRQLLFDMLEDMAPDTPEYRELTAELRETWKELTNLTSYLKDSDMVMDASDTTPRMQELVKQYELAIETLKSRLGVHAPRETEVNEFGELVQGGIDENFISLLQELSELQSKNATDYYSQVMYDKLVELYPMGMSTATDFMHLINTPDFNLWLNKADKTAEEEEFYQWYWRNHLRKSVRGESFVSPTYIWMKITPSNSEHIMVIPSWKYTSRELKDNVNLEYEVDGEKREQFVQIKTQKDDTTWDEVNRRWRPKSADFKNEEYERMKKEPDLFEYLTTILDYMDKIQMDTSRESRNGYKVPSLHKRFGEAFFKTAWKSFVNKVNPAEHGEANINPEQKKTFRQRLEGVLGVPSNEVKQVKTDYLGNKIRKVFTPFTSYMDPEDVTDDALLAVIQYAHGLERVKQMTQSLPKINLLEQIFNQFQPQAKSVVNQYGQTIPAGSNNRLDLLQHLEKTKLYGEFKEFELGKQVDTALLAMRTVTSLGSQSVINLPNAVKNWLQGNLMNLVLSGSYNWNSRKSVLKAMADHKTSFAYFSSQMFQKEKSLDFHIQAFFNPLIERSLNEAFKREAFHIAGQESNIPYIFMSAKFSEFGPSNVLLYSHLYHQQVDYMGGKINLRDALEMRDGKLAVKEGATINGEPIDLQEIKLKHKMMAEEVLGKQWNQTIAQRYTLWSAIEFFKRFFIPGIRKRFGVKRINPVLGETEGYYRTALRFMLGQLYKVIYDSQYNTLLTPEERARVVQARDEFLLMLATYLLVTMGFGFDPDDKDRYKKLKKNSWLQNMALLIALNTKRETDSLNPFPYLTMQNSLLPPVANETFSYIREPFIGFNSVTDLRKLVDTSASLAFGGENARYDRDQPQNFIQKGDTKAGHYLWKLSNFDEFLYQANPERKIQVIVNFGNK